ncbi:MAG: NAD(P)H-dependent oxidoreductase [Chloroflexi bacterium]|nr:NAD(P)H-dependent oxidoreductase [Chloroflexota bacterium]
MKHKHHINYQQATQQTRISALNERRINILAIPGSLRPNSINRGLLEAVREVAPVGVQVQIYGGYAELPVFTEPLDNGPEPESVRELREQIRDADALLFATPEYNGSVPGGLKNAIDWASRPYGNSPLAGKPALVVGASPSPNGARWAQADLRRILGVAGADVIDSELAVGRAPELFDADGQLTDPSTREALADRLRTLLAAVRQYEATPTAA